jgi:hypothetical protein
MELNEKRPRVRYGLLVCWSFSTFSNEEHTRNVKDVSFFNPTGFDPDGWASVAAAWMSWRKFALHAIVTASSSHCIFRRAIGCGPTLGTAREKRRNLKSSSRVMETSPSGGWNTRRPPSYDRSRRVVEGK